MMVVWCIYQHKVVAGSKVYTPPTPPSLNCRKVHKLLTGLHRHLHPLLHSNLFVPPEYPGSEFDRHKTLHLHCHYSSMLYNSNMVCSWSECYESAGNRTTSYDSFNKTLRYEKHPLLALVCSLPTVVYCMTVVCCDFSIRQSKDVPICTCPSSAKVPQTYQLLLGF